MSGPRKRKRRADPRCPGSAEIDAGGRAGSAPLFLLAAAFRERRLASKILAMLGRVLGNRDRCWVGLATIALTAFGLTCAGARGPAPTPAGPPAGEPLDPAIRALEREAERVYDSAEDQFQLANYSVADSLAAVVIEDYAETRWLGPALLLSARVALEENRPAEARSLASRHLRFYRASDPARAPGLVLVARTLHMEGRPLEAGDSLLATPVEMEGDDEAWAAQVTRQVVGDLGLGEIEALLARWPADHPLRPVFEVERASLLIAAGEVDKARSVADSVLALDPEMPERDRARAIAAGETESEQWKPIIGAVLPMSGPLAGYGRMAEEGIRLAIQEYNERYADEIQLIVKDDADRYERDGDLVRELERLGAVAILGPLRSEGLEAAAEGRRDRDLLIVSPTAPENFSFARNTFSMFSTTERVTRSSRTLAGFAVADLKLTRIGVMYPATPEGRMQLAAFADAARARGAEVVASVAYDDTATTFADPMAQLRAERPQAIYAPASTPMSVIQMAPQFSYYGLRGVQVLGDAEWSDPQVARLVEPRFINGTIISTFLDRSSPSVRWTEFQEMYERTYRKGLQDNLVPALAYDAARLVLHALPWGFPRRSAVSRSFSRIRGFPGATGVFTVDAGAVTRTPFLLRFQDRELVPAIDPAGGRGVSPDAEGRR